MKTFLTLVLAVVMTMSTFAQFEKDASHEDLDFWKFKVQLENYVKAKDVHGLKQLLADNVYGNEHNYEMMDVSKEAFIDNYFQEDAEDSWSVLASILRFGFSKNKNRNLAGPVPVPETTFNGPAYLNEINSDTELIILGQNVNIRRFPALDAKIIGKASYEKFDCDCDITTMDKDAYQIADGITWIRIRLADGRTGYVASKYTSFEMTKELTVGKVQGEWKIISFVQSPGC